MVVPNMVSPNMVSPNNVRSNIDIGMENLYIQTKQGRSARERSLSLPSRLASIKWTPSLKPSLLLPGIKAASVRKFQTFWKCMKFQWNFNEISITKFHKVSQSFHIPEIFLEICWFFLIFMILFWFSWNLLNHLWLKNCRVG